MARLRRLEIHYQRVLSEWLPSRLGASWALPAIMPQPEWSPPVDVVETASECSVTLELAGLREDDFEILLYPEHLVIQGERPWRPPGEAARIHRAEIRHGPFHVAVGVPCRASAIDVDRIRVEYQDGVLRVRLPKVQEGKR